MGAILHVLLKYAVILALFPMRLFPVKKNRILMLSDLDGRYAGNPKYLTEYLLKERPGKYEIVFALADPGAYPGLAERGVGTVRKGSFRYYFLAMTSRVFVTDSAGYSFLPLGKRTLVVNTWHGGGAYKKFNLDFFGRTPSLLKNARLNEKKTELNVAVPTKNSHAAPAPHRRRTARNAA
ncbi:MAG: CDP-glycerol glycerophosphotransferase family protein, partial [Clostridia bacterium]|nr:CDP-glycerol glycerophosphotransferase family protein [Clostridia bacterium]